MSYFAQAFAQGEPITTKQRIRFDPVMGEAVGLELMFTKSTTVGAWEVVITDSSGDVVKRFEFSEAMT